MGLQEEGARHSGWVLTGSGPHSSPMRATKAPESPSMTTTTSARQATALAPRRALLIVNADDWGLDRQTTDRTLECCLPGAVSSVSAVVFMEDFGTGGGDRTRAGYRSRSASQLHDAVCGPRRSGEPRGAPAADRWSPVAAPLGANRVSSGARALVRVCRGGTIGRIPPALWGGGGKDRRPSSHASQCERPDAEIAAIGNDGAKEFFVRSRREEFWRTSSIEVSWIAASPAATCSRTISSPSRRSSRQAGCEGFSHWQESLRWRWKRIPSIRMSIAIWPAARFFASWARWLWHGPRSCGRVQATDARGSTAAGLSG